MDSVEPNKPDGKPVRITESTQRQITEMEAAANAAAQFAIQNPQLIGVEIESGEQPWCTIYLKDGNKLRIQLTVAGIFRDDMHCSPDGLPAYHVLSVGSNVQAFPRKQRK